jgi:hypothetical protein
MSATKANINWTSVSFNSVTLTRITNASFGQGGQLLKFKGDVDQYPTVIANVHNEPHASITTADVGTVMSSFTPGLTSTLTASMNDAKLATGGGVVFTLSNAVFENAESQGQHAQFGSVTGTWQAYSTDGATAPLAISRY